MSDAREPFETEVRLLRWSESSTAGRTITLEIPPDAGEAHPFRGLPTGHQHGQRFRMQFVAIGDDERPQDPKAQLKDMLERSREADQEAERQNEDEARCGCGEILIFDDENGIARCPGCKSYESYIPPRNKQNDVGDSGGRAAWLMAHPPSILDGIDLTDRDRHLRSHAAKDRSDTGKKRYANADAMEQARTRAVLLTKDPQFQMWCGYPRDEEKTKAFLYRACHVESRRDIATDPEACKEFLRLEGQYAEATGRLADGRR